MRNSLHTDTFYFLCCPRAIKAIKETSACRLYKHCSIISLNAGVDTNQLCVHTCITQLFLWATRGACNPSLKVVITHCVACIQPAFIWTSTKNEQKAHNAIWSCTFGPSITRILITRVLTICHVKLMQSTALEQKRFDL